MVLKVINPESSIAFVYGALTLSAGAFQTSSTNDRICNSSVPCGSTLTAPYNPRPATPAGYHTDQV